MTSVICRVVPQCKTVAVQKTWLLSQTRLSSHATAVAAPGAHGHVAEHGHGHHRPAYRNSIGDREVVGYGWAGSESYGDSVVWPYPGIRFKEPKSVPASLLQKEKADWRKLTIDEKKTLYRYNYCETFAEMNAPTGDWKSIMGTSMFWISLALWALIALKSISPPLPESFSDESRLAQLERMINLRMGPVEGLSSNWDYEKGRWKDNSKYN